MNDFNGSVAEQNITISTDIVRTAVVGGNFYQSMLYIFDFFEDFGSDTPVYPVVTRQTYKDVIDGYEYLAQEFKNLIKNDLESLYAHNANITVYIIPSAEMPNYRTLAYFNYICIRYVTSTVSSDHDYNFGDYGSITIGSVLNNVKANYNKDFCLYLADHPIDPSTAKSALTFEKMEKTFETTTSRNIKWALFARPAMPTVSSTTGTTSCYLDAELNPIGYSPALYQLGWMLSFANESGTPIGNPSDMKALNFQNVLPTAEDGADVISGASALCAKWFEDHHINYFKPVGDGTANVNNFGGWMINGKDAIVAEWIVAYENFMNRVACAKIITSGNSLKNVRTYDALLDSVKANLIRMVSTGVITNFVMNPPSFENLPITDGQTISIPNAWEADFVQTVHNVRISGTLTVAQ